MNIAQTFFAGALLISIAACAQPAPSAGAPPVVAKPAGAVDGAGIAAADASKPELIVTVPSFANATCPIMGKPVSGKLFVETPKGRVYVCCKSCNQPILDDVDKAIETAYPTVKKAALETCPIMGDPIAPDSPRVTLQGIEIPLCCADCITEAHANDQILLAKATNPTLVDLKNATCPITGQPITNNSFCVVGNEMIHLSSPECIDAVRKDPAAAIAKAKIIAAAHSSSASHG